MKYSESFKIRCKEAFPEWKAMHKALDSGGAIVGRYLKEAIPEVATLATMSGDVDVLAEFAKARTIWALYVEWVDIADNETEPTPDEYTPRERVIIDAMQDRINDLERKIAVLKLERELNKPRRYTVKIYDAHTPEV